DDWTILADLAYAVARKTPGVRGAGLTAYAGSVRALGPRRALDAAMRTGPHRLSVRALEERPHGIDLGPLEPRLPGALPRGRGIRLAPPRLLGDVPRLRAALEALEAANPSGATGPLVLVGRRGLRSNNSWMHNSQRLVKGPVGCT